MRIFLVSQCGETLELARSLTSEEHETFMFIKDKFYRKVGSGIVNVIPDPKNLLTGSDLIIVDDIGSGEFVDRAKKIKKLVIGPGKSAERLKIDPIFGIEILTACDVKVANSHTEGLPATVGAWFNGDCFIKPIFVGVKTTKLAVGDLGPTTKGMGIVGKFTLKSKLFHDTLAKCQAFLKSINYIGFLSLDCLINNNSVHVTGWSPSLSYPVWPLINQMFLSPIGEFYKNLVEQKVTMAPVQIGKIYLGIAAVMPPWPMDSVRFTGRRIEIGCPNISQVGIKKNEEGYIQERMDGLIGLIISHGTTIKEVKDIAYTSIKRIKAQDLFYRTDIEDNNRFLILEELGWWK